ncbi:hypothetical protein PVAP13_8KG022720 [Panicum virgatum]|uniref:Uncharacterized protein n=1 Tax=Panicum virgatum TaxID=38727 RepID=A0A8T0PF11_PANVG|nr:hypothetical protein PVAP13_8KG022720 [Panicum virgatum]
MARRTERVGDSGATGDQHGEPASGLRRPARLRCWATPSGGEARAGGWSRTRGAEVARDGVREPAGAPFFFPLSVMFFFFEGNTVSHVCLRSLGRAGRFHALGWGTR